MNYTQNLTALAQYAGDSGYATDTDFLAQLPTFILSAEQRILRDLDLLAARVEDTTGTTSINQRIFTLPTDVGTFQVVETVSLIITTNGTAYRQPPLTWISREAMEFAYPRTQAVGAPSIPMFVAPYTDLAVLLGPAPGATYSVAVYGQQTPATLSATNTETFISVNLPDLFLAAEMIDVSAWERQFSAMASDPSQARDWNQEYERLLKSADLNECRRQLESVGWSARQPSQFATPPQT